MQSVQSITSYTGSGQQTNGTTDLCNTVQSSISNKTPQQPFGCTCDQTSKWGPVTSGISSNGYPLYGCK